MYKEQLRKYSTIPRNNAFISKTSSTINSLRRPPRASPPDLVISRPYLSWLTKSNPSTNPRKQISKTTELPSVVPSTPSRFRYPLSPHKDTSPHFWDKDSHYSWIDQNTPFK